MVLVICNVLLLNNRYVLQFLCSSWVLLKAACDGMADRVHHLAEDTFLLVTLQRSESLLILFDVLIKISCNLLLIRVLRQAMNKNCEVFGSCVFFIDFFNIKRLRLGGHCVPNEENHVKDDNQPNTKIDIPMVVFQISADVAPINASEIGLKIPIWT